MISVGENLNDDSDSEDFQKFNRVLVLAKDKIFEANSNHLIKGSGEFWKTFESEVNSAMKHACSDLNLKWNVEYVGNHRFPDIVAWINDKEAFGVEVKTLSSGTKDEWKVLGGSVMESTAVKNVQRIHVLCAKKNPFEIKIRPFENCVKDVAVTHSPRYMLDLNLPEKENLFEKIHKSYEKIREMKNPFEAFRQYLVNEASTKKTECPWWMETSDAASDRDLAEIQFVQKVEDSRIRFWNELELSQKQKLSARMLILFPEIFGGDYREAAKWLYRRLIINPSFRDSFSAGGKESVKNSSAKVPKIIANLYRWKDEISGIFQKEFVTLEERYPSLRGISSREKPKAAYECWKKTIPRAKFDEKECGVLDSIVEEIGSKL